MANGKKGFRYEHEIKNGVYEHTKNDDKDGQLIPIRHDFSGNSVTPAADLTINDGRRVHALELKRTSKDVFRIQQEEIEQLVTFCHEHPPPTYPYLGVRFNQRQLVLTKVWMGDGGNNSLAEDAATLCPTEAHATNAGTFVIQKPEAGTWPSASSGDDVEHVLDTIGWYRIGDNIIQGVDVSSVS